MRPSAVLLSLSLGTFSLAAGAQVSGPEISLDGRIILAQNSQAPDPSYYRPVAPQARQAPCGGFGTPPCTGQTIQDTGPTGEQLFIAAKQADANHQPQRSIEYLTRSAEMGYRKAQYALGTDYRNGNGVPKDATKAEYWLDLAAQQGSTSAQQDLGKMDPAQAVHYLQMGAARRDPQSEFTLGVDYELGRGVAHDRAKAMDYFRRASRDGGPNDGEQIAAALARSAPSRRFASGEALMALVPAPQQTAATRRPANCPAWYDSNYFGHAGMAINYGQAFCLAHPNCTFSWGVNNPYTCSGETSPLHWK
jgi:hypothetical protein